MTFGLLFVLCIVAVAAIKTSLLLYWSHKLERLSKEGHNWIYFFKKMFSPQKRFTEDKELWKYFLTIERLNIASNILIMAILFFVLR